MCNWKQMGIALGTGFATSVALINTCSVAYAEAPQEFCLDPDKTKTSIPGDDMSEDDASQTVVSSTTWGIPYHLDWDGRHEQAHRRGITSRSTRLTRQILLVRHGEYVHAESGKDVDRILSEKGRSQAFRVGKYIQQSLRENPLLTGAVKVMGDSSEVNPRRLVVSGLTRAQQTAREILPFLPPRTPVVELSNMNEGIPCPPDPPLARLSKISHKEQRKSAERIENAFNSIFYRPLTKEDEGIDIVVGHANVFRYFICRILQVPPEAWLRMTLGHCSVTRISIYSTGHIKIECVGDVGFLPPDMHTV